MADQKVQRNGDEIVLTFAVDCGKTQAQERLVLRNPERELNDLDFTLSRNILGSFDGKGLTWGNRRVEEYVTFANVTSKLYPRASATELANRYLDHCFWPSEEK